MFQWRSSALLLWCFRLGFILQPLEVSLTNCHITLRLAQLMSCSSWPFSSLLFPNFSQVVCVCQSCDSAHAWRYSWLETVLQTSTIGVHMKYIWTRYVTRAKQESNAAYICEDKLMQQSLLSQRLMTVTNGVL